MLRKEIVPLPTVSVLLAVYNGAQYIQEAIDSILKQTLTQLELIIIDDGSSDDSVAIIQTFKDKRIIFLKNEVNRRKSYTLNRAISIAKGKYLSIMDQDDIAFPQKLERQVSFMEARPEIGICGTQFQTFGQYVDSEVSKYPLSHEEIQLLQLYASPFAHPSVLIRRSALEKLDNFYHENIIAEDYHLWSRLLLVTKGANLPEVLLHYRIHPSSITKVFSKTIEQEQKQIRLIYAEKLLGNKNQQSIHRLFSSSNTIRKQAIKRLKKEQNLFNPSLFNDYLERLNEYLLPRTGWRFLLSRIKNKISN